MYGLNGRTKLPGKAHILLQPPFVLRPHGGRARRFHEQGGEAAPEGPGHSGSGSDDLGIGRGGGKTHQNVLVCVVIAAVLHPGALGQQGYPVGTPAQSQLP